MPWSISSYTTTIAVSNGNNFVFVSEWNKLRYSRQKQSFPRRNFIFFFFYRSWCYPSVLKTLQLYRWLLHKELALRTFLKGKNTSGFESNSDLFRAPFHCTISNPNPKVRFSNNVSPHDLKDSHMLSQSEQSSCFISEEDRKPDFSPKKSFNPIALHLINLLFIMSFNSLWFLYC